MKTIVDSKLLDFTTPDRRQVTIIIKDLIPDKFGHFREGILPLSVQQSDELRRWMLEKIDEPT